MIIIIFTESCSAHVHVRHQRSVTFMVHETSSGIGEVEQNKAARKWDFQRKSSKKKEKKTWIFDWIM